MRWGRTAPGADVLALDADALYLFDVGDPLALPLVVGSLAVNLDGLGPGNGEQVLRPVVMEAGDVATLAVGEEVAVADGQDPGWVHLVFDDPPTLRAGSAPRLGLHVGAASQLARLSGALGQVGVSERYASAYGAAPDLASGATDPGLLAAVCAIGVAPWTPSDLTEEELAALPLHVAQGIFGQAGPVAEGFDAVCGWRYTPDDPPAPSVAVARTGGPIADLVGQRLRLTAQRASGPVDVVVFVDDEQDFDDELAAEDLSLSRAVFAELAPLWTEALSVTVEVLA